MRLLVCASAHTHDKITDQLLRGITFCREELNIEIKPVKAKQLKPLRNHTYLQMLDGRIKLVAHRRDKQPKTRQGPTPATLLENLTPRHERLLVTNTNLLTTDTISYALQQQTSISVLDHGVTLHAEGSAGLEVIQQLNTDRTLNEKHTGGRPPIGCEVANGQLIKGSDYDDVRATLQDVIEGEITKTEAAERLSCARQTITNATQRRTLYNLK